MKLDKNPDRAVSVGVVMVLLIAVLSIGIFLELGGFSLFSNTSHDAHFVPLKDAPLVAVASTSREDIGAAPAEIVDVEKTTTSKEATYLQVKDSCNYSYQGECVRVRSGAGLAHPVVGKLRSGMVLAYEGMVEADGLLWYRIVFNEWLRYPERVTEDWYVAGEFVEEVFDVQQSEASSSKKILVDRGDQTLRAIDGDAVFMEAAISTGLELTPTPRGTFTIFQKLPTRYMQGPLPYLKDQSYYDVPGVPWNLYFTEQGAVIHGAYWHNSFGTPYSHGCVNLPPDEARKLYEWASIGTTVVVTD